jgi:ribose transport system substrate-binding protein
MNHSSMPPSRVRGTDERLRQWRAALAGFTLTGLLAFSGCTTSPSDEGASPEPALDTPSAKTTLASAKEAVEKYTKGPSPFPASTPLSKEIQAGTTITFLQCGSPGCAVLGELIGQAVDALGAEFSVVSAGTTSSSAQNAAASVLANKPDAVIIAGIQPSIFGSSLKNLSSAGVKVIGIGISQDTESYGITFNYSGPSYFQKAGRLLADWVAANNEPDAGVVFYGVPAIAYSEPMKAAFKDEMSDVCPGCAVRTIDINVATLGNSAPQTVVTDLQAHTESDVAVFGIGEIANGLPAALSSGDVTVKTLEFSPGPQQLQYLKDGQLTAALGLDFPVAAWAGVDVAARLILGEEPTPEEVAGEDPIQFLTPESITFDPAMGWTGYPDYADRFTKLWHPND